MAPETSTVARENRQTPFWRFSLDFYGQPGVAPSCLRLQDEGDTDVNVLFYLLFLAFQFRTLPREDVDRIDASIRDWREKVVKPLREVRRLLKGDDAPLKAVTVVAMCVEVKRIELEAEHIQQEQLELMLPAATLGSLATSQADAAMANLTHYAALRGALPEEPLRIVRQAFERYAAERAPVRPSPVGR